VQWPSYEVAAILVCLTLMESEVSRQSIENASSRKSHKNSSIVTRVPPCIKTDRQTDSGQTDGRTDGQADTHEKS